ncbi:uncharacterized protein B0H18DRAFT_218425 [Fomitopsis serialis]|uniref:uncharacterized protein n=1 Tax=Fomitopsis serialis TaxID=139415 RepID=UPI0020075B82|nr:uncharacterized protein B0H18DRAFT_218425 [Neoantrodia serialis]KAH9913017.1 hypothetical protein B0H18DRAFT_218425 [Neoantrodia serialis]
MSVSQQTHYSAVFPDTHGVISRISASKGVLTPRSIIKLSVQANEKAASIRRALGDDGVLRAIKRAKVDVIPTTVPRLRRRMKGEDSRYRLCELSVMVLIMMCLQVKDATGHPHLVRIFAKLFYGRFQIASSRSAVRHSAKTPCSP